MLKFDWWRNSDNRDGASAIFGVLKVVVPAILVIAVAVAGWVGFDLAGEKPGTDAKPAIQTGDNSPVQTGSGTQINLGENGQVIMADPEKVTEAAPSEPVVTMTLAQFEERQLHLKQQITAELEQAQSKDRERLEGELAEVRRRLADLPAAYDEAKALIAELEAQLQQLQGDIPEEKLAAARAALAAGDTSKADALFAKVEAQENAAIERAATAAYARGQIAEGEVRWVDAADHYARSGRLAPNYNRLFAARLFAWRAGRYQDALRFGIDLLALARTGTDQVRLAIALNEHALTLMDAGQYGEAEPLYREALEISRKTVGAKHPSYASHLSGLANLLQVTGRFDEAEPLFREVLEIDRNIIGAEHPDHASHLNSLANLLQATDRVDEAELLYREALEIDRKTRGEKHPDYAVALNNLGTLLRYTGRFDEAEPLYREALGISRKVLGQRHPGYALQLNNLANLLQATDRVEEAESLYREALAIDREVLGDQHPNTAIDLANLGSLVADRGRLAEGREMLEQALQIFRAVLPEDHPHIVETQRMIADLPNAQD